MLPGRAAQVAKLEVFVTVEGGAHVRSQPAARLKADFEQDGKRQPILAIGREKPGGRDRGQTRPSAECPAAMTQGRASVWMTRSRHWKGGAGSRARNRPSSNGRYGSPKASDGFPVANARIRSWSTEHDGARGAAAALCPRLPMAAKPAHARGGGPERLQLVPVGSRELKTHTGDLDDRPAIHQDKRIGDGVWLAAGYPRSLIVTS